MHPNFFLCLQLNLSRNEIGAYWTGSDWVCTPEGPKAISDALSVNGSVTCVDVRDNGIEGEGASQLSAVVLANTKIEVFNEIPIKEMRADSLTELNLKGKGIGVAGGMVIAGLLPVMGSITSVR